MAARDTGRAAKRVKWSTGIWHARLVRDKTFPLPMRIDPAWISSEEHLAEFHQIARGSSLLRKLILGHKMPESFPAVRIGRIWVPIIHFSSGTLEISETGLEYQAAPRNSALRQYRGVRGDLRFSLAASQIKSVRWAPVELTGVKYYSPPFIHIETQTDGAPGSFLICAGGSGPSMKTIRQRTEAMFERLLTLVA